jgi:hypothetical protein
MHASGRLNTNTRMGKHRSQPQSTAGAPSNKVLNKVHERQKLSPFSVNYFHKLKSVGGGPDTIVSHDDSDDLPREFPIMM